MNKIKYSQENTNYSQDNIKFSAGKFLDGNLKIFFESFKVII